MTVIESIEEHPSECDGSRARGSRLSVLRLRDFRLLLIGESISLLGDQFSLIALPWLVLQLTGDALAVGTVLALAGIPRALFMLVGGALTDRFSPRTLMLLSNLLRLVLVGMQAALVLTGAIEAWMVYPFALCFGLADAFFYPAQSAIVPRLVDMDRLQAANSLVGGVAQVSQVAGPVLAGALIALLSGAHPGAGVGDVGGDAPDLYGTGIAFVIDALTFVASVFTLQMIRLPRAQAAAPSADEAVQPAAPGDLIASIVQGIRHVWDDDALRWVFVIIAAVDFLVLGPLLVGIPVLADTRLAEGAMAFGIVMSALGGGALLGIVLAGALPKPSPRHLGPLMVGLTGLFGAALVVFGLTISTSIIAIASFCVGAANGYVNIVFMTWLQSRIPISMLGRVMSLLMFASVGVVPVSQALCGALVTVSLSGVFVGAGMLLLLVTMRIMFVPAVRDMGLPVAAIADENVD